MGVTLMEFGNYMRKGAVFTVRSVWHHPFLVFLACAVIYMSMSFPLMFSLLVSASPVVVCTVILLGTLLYYGQHNIHETEIEMKTKYESVSLRNGKLIDASVVVEQNERPFVEKCGESVEKKLGVVESSLLGHKPDEIHVGGSVDGSNKGRRLSEIESECGEESEALGGPVHVHGEKGEWSEEREREGLGDGEVMADHYAIISKVIGELLDSESDHEKSEGDSCDSERGNREEHHEEGSDSGSERAESSSPDDTSIDDIMPTMLDELHPLLDEDAPPPAQMSHAGSETALTDQSPRSSNASIESADETDVQESEAADDDDDVEEGQDDEEDHTKSVITWTEEDQKNLMEVGNSELERNQRLERILRRRRNRSMVPEINLMNFENPDFQFQIAPISTARRNPFDLPQDSGPGSAPSVLSRRRTNPFELPDDLTEEDPNETGDGSRAELKPSLTRHPFLRRRDNFSARPSIFSPNRLERRPVKIKPFFVAEQRVVDESSYSPFKRESSGQSSPPEDTESVASAEYLEDEGSDDLQDAIEDDPSNDQEAVSESKLADEVPIREPMYDTDTSPKARPLDDDGVQVRDTSSAH
ncbi:uncharacterized protein LOC130990133 [Salvia miltiorrhiza]|uniref:uncharacterized protein LOC130990133 n=1 Tax=Salvia miltiorrhiza TaxID=226208 RepID=UPI0025ABBE96|nr:uncharacterized protein LOC130990133 [Salvia miltiorrhiza]